VIPRYASRSNMRRHHRAVTSADGQGGRGPADQVGSVTDVVTDQRRRNIRQVQLQFDDEEDVEPGHRDGLDRQEVTGEGAGGMSEGTASSSGRPGEVPVRGGGGAGWCAPRSPRPARRACGTRRRSAGIPSGDSPEPDAGPDRLSPGPTLEGVGRWWGKSSAGGPGHGANEAMSTGDQEDRPVTAGQQLSPGSRGSSGRPACSEVGLFAGAAPRVGGAARRFLRLWRPMTGPGRSRLREGSCRSPMPGVHRRFQRWRRWAASPSRQVAARVPRLIGSSSES
jgi:hypothetical protein